MVPDFMVWRCANCDAAAQGTTKPCDCATNVGVRTGPNGKREQTWWDDPKVTELSDLRARLATYEAALRPFVEAFEKARNAYADRYQDRELGLANFDKMPGQWPMEKLTCDMNTYRIARKALEDNT